MRNTFELLYKGMRAQIEKLEENSHKDDWEDMDLQTLFTHLCDEVDELEQEVTQNGTFLALRREAADVANFAHMIIALCNKELTT